MAKKLASVAVWMSVYELRKLLTTQSRPRVHVRSGGDRQHGAEREDHEHQAGLWRREDSLQHLGVGSLCEKRSAQRTSGSE